MTCSAELRPDMTTISERERLFEALTQDAQQLPFQLSDRQRYQLIDYIMLLNKWNAVYNLTAIRDPMQMLSQHLLDSLSVVPFLGEAHRILDVGAGGGLPGIVLSIWAKEFRPDMQFELIDVVQKKTAFLTQVKSELTLSNVTVRTGRVEALTVLERFDVITSRAFADLADFVEWSGHLLAENGRFLAMKGSLPTEEIKRLPQDWQVSHVEVLSVPTVHAQRHLVIVERV